MTVHAFFDADGKCTRVVDGPLSEGHITEGDSYMAELPLFIEANAIYFDTTALEVRGKQPFFVGVRPNLVSKVPAGTTALVGPAGTEVQVDDGTLELEVDYAETVTVTLTHPRYLSRTLEVPCEAQG